MIYKNSMAETYEFIGKYNYECLWRLYAKKAMEEFDYINAEKGLLKCNDYKSL
jgi:hypothetical protein